MFGGISNLKKYFIDRYIVQNGQYKKIGCALNYNNIIFYR